jgi:hypothetical protein
LWLHSARYRDLWGGDPAEATPARDPWKARPAAAKIPGERPACRHLGDATGDTVTCPTCTGTRRLKLYLCAEFGTCTLDKAIANDDGTTLAGCQGCGRYAAPPNIVADGLPTVS